MNLLLDQIDSAIASGCIYPAVLSALTVPDAAGAVEYGFQTQIGERYTKWMDAHFLPQYPSYTGVHGFDSTCFYAARCVFLHESNNTISTTRAARHSILAQEKSAVLFNCDNSVRLHLTTSWKPGTPGNRTILDGSEFCKEMTDSARKWLTTKIGSAQAQAELDAMVSIQTYGTMTFVDGEPAIVKSKLLIG